MDQRTFFQFGNETYFAEEKMGTNTWKARDIETGEYVSITVWQFCLEKIDQKCPMSCEYIAKPPECQGHKNVIHAILKEFHARANYLIQKVKHKNLVRYLGVDSSVYGSLLEIRVAQEFVEGDSIQEICESGQLLNVSVVGKEVLESIIYLQNKANGITHGFLNDKSIFMDKNGVCRVADYNLIPYLMYLKGEYCLHRESDLNAIGNLVNKLSDAMKKASEDFINKCCSGRIVTSEKLLEHPFVSRLYRTKKPSQNGLSVDSFDIETCLGCGSFGTVLKAKQRVDNKHYALKIIVMPESENLYDKVSREAELMSTVDNKNVVRYITSWKQHGVNLPAFRNEYNIPLDDDDGEEEYESSSEKMKLRKPERTIADIMIIQMELYTTNLRAVIDNERLYCDEARIANLFREISLGLSYIHCAKIIHRDFKPENILLDPKGHPKISDFGLATTISLVLQQRPRAYHTNNRNALHSSQTGMAGTYGYIAPELEKGPARSVYTYKSDVYSFGIVFFEMCHPPFKTTMERWNVLNEIRKKEVHVPNFLSNGKKKVIQLMLNHDPKQRPTSKRARLMYKKLWEDECKVLNRVFTPWDDCEDLSESDDDECIPSSRSIKKIDEKMEID